MVRMNWDWILSVRASALTDQEIEDLFPMVISCDVESVDDIYKLKMLMKLSQEMLQQKDNQVESLLLECDDLKQKILDSKTGSTSKRKKSLASDLVNNREEDASVLAVDNQIAKGKSEKIATLMSELEALENQNFTLKEKLRIIKEEMKDATLHMNKMTEELSSLKEKNLSYKEKLIELERENQALITQIHTINDQQLDRDNVLDEFSTAIDARVTEWKLILDEKDAEISALRENLSQSLMQSLTSVREENKSQIVHLNRVINQRDKTIGELQNKLSEAVAEMNESTILMEKLKADAQKIEKGNRRKDQRSLLQKIQELTEELSNLKNVLAQSENDAEIKSKELCEALAMLKKYENGEYGLAEAIEDLKTLKDQLKQKDEHIEDLINVINRMEMLNSHQEIEIAALCQKLGLSPSHAVPTDGIVAKHKEEMRRAENMKLENEFLKKENLELQSDVRTMKYKLKNVGQKGVIVSREKETEDQTDLVESDAKIREMNYDWVTEREEVARRHMTEIEDIKDNVRIVVEENEALRKGMHEILDSVHNQDGSCAVEIQSETLETLLEALDVRHLAGWYHPAMRLQSRLSVVEGSNSELRTQLKQTRSELQKKDEILQQIVIAGNSYKKKDPSESISESGELTGAFDSSGVTQELREKYDVKKSEWQKEKDVLYEEKNELEETITRLEVQLEEYEKNWQVLESGDDEVKKIFAKQSKESAEHAVQTIVLNRKCKILEELLSKESTKTYNSEKEGITRENKLRKRLADMEKWKKIFEAKIATLQSNLSNSISLVEHNELKEKYNEVCVRLRFLMDENRAFSENGRTPESKNEEELQSQGTTDEGDRITGDDGHLEKQLASLTKLYKISQSQVEKLETECTGLKNAKSELQERIIELNKQLSKYAEARLQNDSKSEEKQKKLSELEEKISSLEADNENLRRKVKIADEEAQMYAAQNFTKSFEMDSLRHQLLDLQSVSEDKEIIARLGFELTNCKLLEAETSKRNIFLQSEISHLEEENDKLKQKFEESQTIVRDCRRQCDARCRSYLDLVDFLQRQYGGSTSLTALERFESMSKKLKSDQTAVEKSLGEVLKIEQNSRAQQEVLAGRLQVVEQLKDILEQQIGGADVQDLIHRFSENSQSMLGELKHKRQISQLENELQIANSRVISLESVINEMESEIITIQKIWNRSSNRKEETREVKPISDVDVVDIETISIGVQTLVENRSVETQVELESSDSPGEKRAAVVPKTEKKPRSISCEEAPDRDSQIILNERLNQALSLASERSAMLVKYESEIAEYQAKIITLSKQIEEKNSLLIEKEKIVEERFGLEASAPNLNIPDVETSDKIALRSTVNSLQRMVTQKEETIVRYQNLLKEDRDEHSKSAARLQEEIKGLQARIGSMQLQVNQKISDYIHPAIEALKPVKEKVRDDRNKNIDLEEEAEKLNERVSTLEADLNIAKELGERWHRLAEERLKHMDHMRERLEEQHKNELESYRMERDKWQLEADTLRKQLSDNRMQLAKGNSLLTKELQERDNRIHELDIAYQQLRDEMELAEKDTVTQQIVAHDSKMQEISNNIGRVQSNQLHQLQAQLDLARRQLHALVEKEKNYKSQIFDLKQQLSRRYMAAKTHEQKTSQREIQLERKARGLEEELHTLRLELEREKFTNENKKLKTAEELALWDKQKRWQQTAEKYKEKLKEKTEEYNKLQTGNEKLRAVVSCMEREKWYLRSKLRCENGCLIGSISARPGSIGRTDVLEDLQHECLTLRGRVRELTDRLESTDTAELVSKIEDQRRQICALEAVTKGNEYVVDQLERLEATKDVLEKNNLKLESENLELRLEIERIVLETPRLREKVEHLEKYVELLKVEKSSESSPRSFEKDSHQDQGKKSVAELEKTVFTLKRVVEKLQAENKRLSIIVKKNPVETHATTRSNSASSLQNQLYERAQQRVVALETDLQLAEQRISMLENARKEEENSGEIGILRHQLAHKSELLDKVKQLLTRAAINEKSLRQRVQMLEAKQSLETIPECYVSPPTPDN